MYEEAISRLSESGRSKSSALTANPISFIVGSAMAGAYIGFGDIIMFTVGAHADPAWSHLVMGAVFASALTIVIFAGSELFTGMAMYMPLALLSGKTGLIDLLRVWILCWLGNFAGAFLLAVLFKLGGGGVLLGDGSPAFFAAVAAKISAPAHELFARGIICNWLVCLAIWMAYRTENDAAKVFLIFWPIMIFVAAGFEHCVANMFAFSLALLGPHPATISVYGALHNLVFVTLGNIVGGGIMVAGGYWVQFAGTAQATSTLAARRTTPPVSRNS
ncbi:formate/nitrite transporter family protein [Phyllobacterium endophyticum]|uniref:Nitrite transporter NirC n=1 Tax=Phyllobacterium endophyticum TaxID=1149773 RepID=A0A2P7B0W1_9HYPH|nr:formate/nitrite transporter family protein [Phyllobacterium endophyticum]MBB3237570.1 nitrite transporter NirC [Phyllobacterium endophyticum]PSH60044.1 nitrite transporter NirC [Phyllobacterium endophyticum]TYR42211.1 formate/nitrite transporter family protein [Phyllobacterium endophyticum]